MEPIYTLKKPQKKQNVPREIEEAKNMVNFIFEEDERIISDPMHYKRSLRNNRYPSLFKKSEWLILMDEGNSTKKLRKGSF